MENSNINIEPSNNNQINSNEQDNGSHGVIDPRNSNQRFNLAFNIPLESSSQIGVPLEGNPNNLSTVRILEGLNLSGNKDSKESFQKNMTDTLDIHAPAQCYMNLQILTNQKLNKQKQILKRQKKKDKYAKLKKLNNRKNLTSFLLRKPNRRPFIPFYYKFNARTKLRELVQLECDLPFLQGLISQLCPQEFDEWQLPKLNARNILQGTFNINFQVNEYMSSSNHQENALHNGTNSILNTRMNRWANITYLCDHNPDFKAKQLGGLVSGYQDYLKKYVLNTSVNQNAYENLSREQLIAMLNSQANNTVLVQANMTNQHVNLQIQSQLMNSIDPNYSAFTDTLMWIGITDLSLLNTNLFSDINVRESIRTTITQLRIDLESLNLSHTLFTDFKTYMKAKLIELLQA